MVEIRLLDVSADADEISDLRIMVDQKHIKHLTVDPGVYDNPTMCFSPWLAAALPPLPEGQWNSAHISSDPTSGTPYFSHVEITPLPGVSRLWHPLYIDYLDLQLGRKLLFNVQEATCPQIEGKVVVKLARFPWEIPLLEQETQAYEWIKDTGVGPTFLAHLTEEGRTIGFVMEHIANARHAEPEDLSLCKGAVDRLHQLGIKHGDVNKHNMLIRDESVTLIDFACAMQCQDPEILAAELLSLESELRDMSGRGRPMADSSVGGGIA